MVATRSLKGRAAPRDAGSEGREHRSAHPEALRRGGGGAGRRQGGRARAHRGLRGQQAHRRSREGGQGAAVPPSPDRSSAHARRSRLPASRARADARPRPDGQRGRRVRARGARQPQGLRQQLGDGPVPARRPQPVPDVASPDSRGSGGGDQPGHRPRRRRRRRRHRHLRRQHPGNRTHRAALPPGPARRRRPRQASAAQAVVRPARPRCCRTTSWECRRAARSTRW